MSDLPSHASPVLAPQPRPSSQYLNHWDDASDGGISTPTLPAALISPAFTPPATPGGSTTPSHDRHHDHVPTGIPVDSTADPKIKSPRLLEQLPTVECIVRARIPTVNGAEMFLHLYQNDTDNKEHLAIVFGNHIRSHSLDRVREGETEMDRMIRGAYVGRLRPGRTSSWVDPAEQPLDRRKPRSSPLSSVPEDTTIPSKTTSGPAPSSDPVLELKPALVRIHSSCYTGETAWSARCDCGEQLDEAARLMSLPSNLATSLGGVIIYLIQEGRGIGLGEKLKAYNLQDMGADTVEANLLLRHPADARSYGLATAMLLDLGLGDQDVSTGTTAEAGISGAIQPNPSPEPPFIPQARGSLGIRLLTNNPDKVRAIEGPNREIRVRERVAMVPVSWKTGGQKGVKSVELEKYLQTKVNKMGHMISE